MWSQRILTFFVHFYFVNFKKKEKPFYNIIKHFMVISLHVRGCILVLCCVSSTGSAHILFPSFSWQEIFKTAFHFVLRGKKRDIKSVFFVSLHSACQKCDVWIDFVHTYLNYFFSGLQSLRSSRKRTHSRENHQE